MNADAMATMAREVGETVKGYFARSVEPLLLRIAALEDRAPEKGEKGDTGEPGEKGQDGLPGMDAAAQVAAIEIAVKAAVADMPKPKDGADGKSVDMEWVKQMLQAEVAEIAKSVQHGRDGKDGADADPEVIKRTVEKAVAEIPRPKDGESIDIEVVRSLVRGEVAEVAKAITNGRDGRDGEPGRDAFAIEVLPEIDFERRYQRGTWAKHAGGLWLARAQTSGSAGWECLVVGTASVEIEDLDERTSVVKHILSDGTVETHTQKSRVMIYRDVYREGEGYEPGDVVTWGGSLWHCNESTKDKPIDGGKAWTLAAKRGRDGRDGKS